MTEKSEVEEPYIKWLSTIPQKAVALKLVLLSGRGFPDRTILCNGKVFFIEFKKPKGSIKFTYLQKKWFKVLGELGFNCYLCRTLDDAIEITRKELE